MPKNQFTRKDMKQYEKDVIAKHEMLKETTALPPTFIVPEYTPKAQKSKERLPESLLQVKKPKRKIAR